MHILCARNALRCARLVHHLTASGVLVLQPRTWRGRMKDLRCETQHRSNLKCCLLPGARGEQPTTVERDSRRRATCLRGDPGRILRPTMTHSGGEAPPIRCGWAIQLNSRSEAKR